MRIRHPSKDKGKKIVIIVGGGFGGLSAAKHLARRDEVYVFLIDRKNHHLFQPLLYQVATAGLDPGEIAVPIRSEFADVANVEVHWEHVTGVDLNRNILFAGVNEIEFDYLVLACGARHSYFGHSEWEPLAPGLKTLEQAIEIRRRILSAFELAENEFDPVKQAELLTFIVVGGGPTGVELAGAIADISRTVLLRDFRRIDPSWAKIILVEAGPRILSSFIAELSAKAEGDLRDLGVDVRTSARVEKIDEDGAQIVAVSGEVGSQFIRTRNIFWAAGVRAAQIEFTPQVAHDRVGRVVVQENFSLAAAPNVFVIGDMAALEIEPGRMLPGLAPAAIQAGGYVARAILRSIHGLAMEKFVYNDRGQMAAIGRSRAVVQLRHLRMTGFLAWILWIFVHIFLLIGFKNRVIVLFEWAWSYLFSKRGSRLITERE